MSIDHESAAAALYGTAATRHEPEPPAQAPQPTGDAPGARLQEQMATAEGQADKLFNHPAEQHDAAGYDKVQASTQRVIEAAAVERFGLEPADARESAQEWAGVFNRYSLSSAESQHLTEIAVGVMTGSTEVDALAWANDARAALTSEYGDSAETMLAASRKLVAQDPKLYDYLHRTGLGSHPKVVLAIARKARSLQRAGRL